MRYSFIRNQNVDFSLPLAPTFLLGLITQPLYIYSTFEPSKPADSVRYSYTLTYSGFPLRETGFVFCQVSMLTTTAIRVDRLLALFTEIRYRKVGTLTRAHVFIAFPWLFCVAAGLSSYFYTWRDYFVKLHYSFSMYGYLDRFCYMNISLKLCNHHAEVLFQQAKLAGKRIPINVARYRRTVSNALWVQF